jgi:double-stranded uracil-DNA glycosylase
MPPLPSHGREAGRALSPARDPPAHGLSPARLDELPPRLAAELAAGGMPPSRPLALSAVPDVLAPGVELVFCGINPGRVSAAAGAAFANPRNDFWRLLHDAGFTPRELAPQEQLALLDYGYGLTNAARRTTRGSGDLRARDYEGAAERLQAIATELRPLVIAFVGKAAYHGTFRQRPDHGLQERRFASTLLYVLPSPSPANAAVSYEERLRWFRALYDFLNPPKREAVRAIVVDAEKRLLLYRFGSPGGTRFWAAPGGGVEEGETYDEAVRRELREEVGLRDPELGPVVWTREHRFVWYRVVDQVERYYLVQVESHVVAPELDLAEEGMEEWQWWTLDELRATRDELVPRRLPELLEDLLTAGPPPEPVDAGV